jgi:hypothetical protein
MSDDRSKAGGADRQRIDIHQDDDLRAWAKKLGVSEQDICDAVAKVGVMSEDVERELKRRP